MAVAVPMRVNDVDVLVEVVSVAGSEPTSRLDRARDRAVDAFDRARETIVAVATSTVEVIGDLGRRSAAPQQIEVEFGLKFSAQGNVIVAGGTGEATLLVRLAYSGAAIDPARAAPPPAAGPPPADAGHG